MKNYLIIFYFPLRYSFGENCTFVGPGHGSVVSLKNEDWFIYHAWAFKKIGPEHPGRMLMLGMVSHRPVPFHDFMLFVVLSHF